MPTVSCPRCSKKMPLRSTFCRRCGLQLNAVTGDERPAAPASAVGARDELSGHAGRPYKLIFALGVLAAFGVMMVIVLWLVRVRSSETTVARSAEAQAIQEAKRAENQAIATARPTCRRCRRSHRSPANCRTTFRRGAMSRPTATSAGSC